MNILKHLSIAAIGLLIILGACNDDQSEEPKGDINLSNGLIAYYTLNNNANDSGINGLNGVLGDGIGNNEPTVTTDRNGMANSAYEFDGSIQYID